MHPNDTVLNDYIDGALGAAERAEVEQHLAGCTACRQTIDDLREILGAARELDVHEPPVRAWARLERAIKLEREHAAPSSAAHGSSTGARGALSGARGASSGARGFQPSGT